MSDFKRRSIPPGWGAFGLITITCLLGTVAGIFNRTSWIGELSIHFRVQYVLWLTIAAIVCVWRHRRAAAALCAASSLINVLFLIPFFYAPHFAQPPASAVTLKVVSLNVHLANTHFDRVANFLNATGADIIVLEEVDARWLDELRPRLKAYKEEISEARYDCFGMALFCRIPLIDRQIIELVDPGIPTVQARLMLDGRPLTLYGMHPPPPMSPAHARARNRQLQALARRLILSGGPAVVVGDLNMTSWSPFFSDFLKDTNLLDTRIGRGVQGSWPSPLPIFLNIPIDHALVSKDFVVRRRLLGPHVGSDHRPVILEISWAGTERPKLKP